MNWIVSAFGWLTGNSKSADNAMKAVDALVYTDEEKAVANQKILDFKIEYAKHTQNQSIARRVIAFIVSGLWGALIMIAVIAGYFDRSEGSYSEFVGQIVITNINPVFMIIIGFYFAAHMVGKFKG